MAEEKKSSDTTKESNVEIKNLERSQIEIIASIPTDEFGSYRKQAVKTLGKDVEMDGFRKGHVPENVLEKQIGEAAILEEMSELAIQDAYPKIVLEHKLNVIGRPEVSITKVAMGNPLEFKIITAVIPEITLPDYKKIAKRTTKKTDVAVTDKELQETITEVKKVRARVDAEKKGEEVKEVADADLPELDDAYVQSLGGFKDVADFMEKVKANILAEKERAEREKNRVAIMEAIVKATKVDLPNVVIEGEIDRMYNQFEHDVSRMGLKMEDYLKRSEKTLEDMRKEWRPDAENRAKTQFTLSRIAIAEKIEIPEEEMKTEVDRLLAQYKDADPKSVRSYVETVLHNERVLTMLERGEDAPEKKDTPTESSADNKKEK